MKPFVFAFFALSAILACFAAPPEGRIVGGDDAILGQLPYQAALSIGGEPTCGATVISERYVLTAMQCVCSNGQDRPWPPQLFRVAAGTTDLYTGGQRIVVEKITVNPNYSEFRTGIALLRLAEPLVFNEYVKAIPLARENPPIGADVDISGWGRIKDNEKNLYRTLQVNAAEVLGATQCIQVIGKIDSQILCLGHARKNGICGGDFGGPAVYQEQLVGVAAYVVNECGSLAPDVFTSVAKNYDWIVENMSD